LPGRGTQVSFPKIPALADGGIVTGPTLALIGEAGPEAVVPLDRMGGMGGAINITVNAGLVSSPDQVGQQIIEAIQKAQRRSGPVFAPA
jgi:phage-related minor tail protein